jgi:hypothetical protein
MAGLLTIYGCLAMLLSFTIGSYFGMSIINSSTTFLSCNQTHFSLFHAGLWQTGLGQAGLEQSQQQATEKNNKGQKNKTDNTSKTSKQNTTPLRRNDSNKKKASKLPGYECMDLGPVVDIADLRPTMLNEYCHNVSTSVAFCSPGMFLCQADSHPGWKFFLRGLQTWRHTSPVLPEDTDDGWKTFLLTYGLHLAV